MELVKLIIILGFAHSIGDLALQTQWIAMYKNPNNAFVGYGGKAQTIWPMVLLGHGMINGAVYYFVTGSLIIGVLETIIHVIIDYGAVTGRYGMLVDQLLHGVCILIWSCLLLYRL